MKIGKNMKQCLIGIILGLTFSACGDYTTTDPEPTYAYYSEITTSRQHIQADYNYFEDYIGNFENYCSLEVSYNNYDTKITLEDEEYSYTSISDYRNTVMFIIDKPGYFTLGAEAYDSDIIDMTLYCY